MKAIQTKYLGPTNTRGARIKASAEGVPSRFYPYDYNWDASDGHRRAAIQFIGALGWGKNWRVQGLASGALPDGSYAHCFYVKTTE